MSKPREDHFEEFQGHTLLKHLILDKYLKAWANKLLQWGAAGSRVWFVDAFAGEGADKKGNPGSPLIAAKMARDRPTQTYELSLSKGTRPGSEFSRA